MIRKFSLARVGLLLTVAVSLLAGTRDGSAVIQELYLGDRVAGTLHADQDIFPFYAAAGTRIRIAVQPDTFLAVTVSLYGPDGQPVAGLTPTTAGAGRTTISGVLPATGNHALVVAAANGGWGTYLLRTAGRAPTSIKGTGYVTSAGEQTITLDCDVASSLLISLKIKAGATTLSLDAAGTLTGPDGGAVALGAQQASGTMLVAANAFLAEEGTYRFKFTPSGTGPYTHRIRMKHPRLVASTLTLPQDRPAVAPVPATGTSIQVSPPANGTHFLSGESGWITVVLKDDSGNSLALSQLSQARLHLYGPQETLQTTTALNLLRASGDRSKSLHHYIDLKTNPDVIRIDNMALYPLSPVDSELPGTYTASLWAVLAADTLQQWFPVADCQIKTAVAETQIVQKENCAKCHFGPISGKFYLAHIDGSSSNPNGNQGIDQWPVRTCKSCHNQEGYSAYRDPRTGDRIVDPIVKRVHGVHNGEELEAPENVGNWLTITNVVGTFAVDDTVTGGTSGATAEIGLVVTNSATVIVVGDITGTYVTGETLSNGSGATAKLSLLRSAVFGDYKYLVFPADVRNCTKCHVDDRWKTQPSRLACGACHDNIWFGAPSAVPAGYENHPGGPQPTDANCLVCHGAGAPEDIAVKHEVAPPAFKYTVNLSLTPPANGSYYVAGEAPLLTIVVRDLITSNAIDHTTITTSRFGRVNLFVNGPRSQRHPVLTTAARAETTATNAAPWDLSATGSFKFRIGRTSFTLTPPTNSATTADQFVTWLNNNSSFAAVGWAESDGTYATLLARPSIERNELEILASGVSTNMGWLVATNQARAASSSYAANDWRIDANPSVRDPKASWTTTNVTYQLDDVEGLEPGTYSAWAEIGGGADGYPVSWGLLNFQVGTATSEPKVATNCTDCHGDSRMHASYFAVQFNTDICGSCHDYRRQMADRQAGDAVDGWGANAASGRSNYGFGAAPIARRVHGVHRGHYLEKPEEVHGSYDYSPVIFPQDIRNCTKCHAETASWTEEPSRIACLACHDSDAAKIHGNLMTYMLNPDDPYGSGAEESCAVCHGEDGDFAPSKVHKISDPYAPPYLREPEE